MLHSKMHDVVFYAISLKPLCQRFFIVEKRSDSSDSTIPKNKSYCQYIIIRKLNDEMYQSSEFNNPQLPKHPMSQNPTDLLAIHYLLEIGSMTLW